MNNHNWLYWGAVSVVSITLLVVTCVVSTIGGYLIGWTARRSET